MTSTTAPTIRSTGPIDADNIGRLALMAHPKLDRPALDGIRERVRRSLPDTVTARVTTSVTRRDGGELSMLSSVRAVSEGVGDPARSFIYCAPPLDWALSKKREPLPLRHRKTLGGRLFEVMLLATLPKYRRSGYAGALLADAEQRYEAAGYAAALVVLNGDQSGAVRSWYEERGYVVGEPDVSGVVRYWEHRALETGFDNRPGQSMGFKALHPAVSVRRRADGTVVLSGILDVPAGDEEGPARADGA